LRNAQWNVSFIDIVNFNVVIIQWLDYEFSIFYFNVEMILKFIMLLFNSMKFMLIAKFYQVQSSNARLIQIDWNCDFSSWMLHQVCNWNRGCWMECKLRYYYLVQWNWNVKVKCYWMIDRFNLELFFFQINS